MTPGAAPGPDARLAEIQDQAIQSIQRAADEAALEQARIRFLGRKSALKELLSSVGAMDDPDARRRLGAAGNAVRVAITAALDTRQADLAGHRLAGIASSEAIDLTYPGIAPHRGRLHPVHTVMREIEEIFRGLGYDIVRGPEVETDHYNFEALNMPPGHPARDGFDTLFIADDLEPRVEGPGVETRVVLRTHTSPMQVRVMEAQPPPIRVIVPGKTYRRDSDATHTPMFHQVEGLVVDEGVTVGDLKGTLEYFARAMFGADRRVRLRPTHFPFTEPSIEADVSCFQCAGSGCRLCGMSGWIEMLGSGMVHPNVLRHGGIDPETHTGFAFGMGVDRIAMLKYGIDDLRLIFENDIRFLEQF